MKKVNVSLLAAVALSSALGAGFANAGDGLDITESVSNFIQSTQMTQSDGHSNNGRNSQEQDLSDISLVSLEEGSYRANGRDDDANDNFQDAEEEFHSLPPSPTSPSAPSAHSVHTATSSVKPDQVAIDMSAADVDTTKVADMNMADYCEESFFPEDRAAAPAICSVDSTFLKTLVNFKEYFSPMTKKRAAYFAGYAAVAGGLAALQYQFGIFGYVAEAVRAENTVAMALLYGGEPISALMDLASARYGSAAPSMTDAEKLEQTKEIALVIPAHNSSAIIKKTLVAAMKHFLPEQIFVVDNGSGKDPSDNTQERIKAISPEINYIYQAIGNKTVAQYAGAMAADKRGYKYIMTTDDDVTLPDNFDFGISRLTDEVKGVVFPIRATSPDGESSILVDWQDIEYRMSDLSKLAEREEVNYPHGAGSLFEVKTFLEILKNHHDTIFHAEDMKLGFGMGNIGKKMVMVSGSVLATDAPTSILGKGPNHYRQRVRCWNMTETVMLGKLIKKAFSPFGPGKWKFDLGTVIRKKNEVSAVLGVLSSYIKAPVIGLLAADAIMTGNPDFAIKFAVFNAGSMITPILVNWAGPIDGRPELKMKARAILTYPVYKQLSAAESVLAGLRAIFFYLPKNTAVPTICEMEEARNPKCQWLKPNGGVRGQVAAPELERDLELGSAE